MGTLVWNLERFGLGRFGSFYLEIKVILGRFRRKIGG